MKGVPLRLEIGPRDVAENQAVIARRDKGAKEKQTVSLNGIQPVIRDLLDDIQRSMLADALKFREENSHQVNSYDEFKDVLENQLGFVYAHWCGDTACEQRVQEETKATIRCIPFDQASESGACVCCGKPSKMRVPFAKAY